jgi:hypothetical protein
MLLLLCEKEAKIVMSVGVVGVEPEGLFKLFDGAAQVSRLG